MLGRFLCLLGSHYHRKRRPWGCSRRPLGAPLAGTLCCSWHPPGHPSPHFLTTPQLPPWSLNLYFMNKNIVRQSVQKDTFSLWYTIYFTSSRCRFLRHWIAKSVCDQKVLLLVIFKKRRQSNSGLWKRTYKSTWLNLNIQEVKMCKMKLIQLGRVHVCVSKENIT